MSYKWPQPPSTAPQSGANFDQFFSSHFPLPVFDPAHTSIFGMVWGAFRYLIARSVFGLLSFLSLPFIMLFAALYRGLILLALYMGVSVLAGSFWYPGDFHGFSPTGAFKGAINGLYILKGPIVMAFDGATCLTVGRCGIWNDDDPRNADHRYLTDVPFPCYGWDIGSRAEDCSGDKTPSRAEEKARLDAADKAETAAFDAKFPGERARQHEYDMVVLAVRVATAADPRQRRHGLPCAHVDIFSVPRGPDGIPGGGAGPTLVGLRLFEQRIGLNCAGKACFCEANWQEAQAAATAADQAAAVSASQFHQERTRLVEALRGSHDFVVSRTGRGSVKRDQVDSWQSCVEAVLEAKVARPTMPPLPAILHAEELKTEGDVMVAGLPGKDPSANVTEEDWQQLRASEREYGLDCTGPACVCK